MTDKLKMMANQIARNLRRGHGDPAIAVAEHLNMFWAPDMRAALLGALAAATVGFEPEVVAAQAHIRTPDRQA